MDSTLLELADRNRREALSILETLQIEAIWHRSAPRPIWWARSARDC